MGADTDCTMVTGGWRLCMGLTLLAFACHCTTETSMEVRELSELESYALAAEATDERAVSQNAKYRSRLERDHLAASQKTSYFSVVPAKLGNNLDASDYAEPVNQKSKKSATAAHQHPDKTTTEHTTKAKHVHTKHAAQPKHAKNSAKKSDEERKATDEVNRAMADSSPAKQSKAAGPDVKKTGEAKQVADSSPAKQSKTASKTASSPAKQSETAGANDNTTNEAKQVADSRPAKQSKTAGAITVGDLGNMLVKSYADDNKTGEAKQVADSRPQKQSKTAGADDNKTGEAKQVADSRPQKQEKEHHEPKHQDDDLQDLLDDYNY